MSSKMKSKKATLVLGIISIAIAILNLLYHIFTNRSLGFAIAILCCMITINAGAYQLDKKQR